MLRKGPFPLKNWCVRRKKREKEGKKNGWGMCV
jgi:hypothetical protein